MARSSTTFQKGKPKSGGRKKGTPNRRTVEVQEKLAALNCDPVEGMARIALDDKNPPELRLRAYAELAPYVYPKRKAVEVSGEGRGPINMRVFLHPPSAGRRSDA